MNKPSEPGFRRILLVIDPSASTSEGVDAAVALAGKIRAELEGLFIEDTDVLRSAQVPFVRQVNRLTGVAEMFEHGSVEQELRSQARAAQGRLFDVARALRVKTSFRVVRGKLDAELRSVASNFDLLIFGFSRTAPPRSQTTEPLRLAELLDLPVCLSGPTSEMGEHVRVLYDGSERAGRALRAAVKLARSAGVGMDVAVTTDDADQFETLKTEVVEAVEAEHIKAIVRKQGGAFPIPEAWLQGKTCTPLVISRTSTILLQINVSELLDRLGGPIVLV